MSETEQASYAIDIAASMPAGEQTIAQLEQLNSQLMATGQTAASLHDAVAKLSNDLDQAAAASMAANAALAAGSSEYALLERAALQAAKAVEKAGKDGVMGVSPELAANAAAAAGALQAYSGKLAGLESDAAKAAAAQAKLSQDLSNARKLQKLGLEGIADAAKRAAAAEKGEAAEAAKAAKAAQDAAKGFGKHNEAIEKLRGGLQAVGGPLGSMASMALAPVQGFAKLSAGVGGSNAALLAGVVGVTALAAAVAALTIAVVAGTAAIAGWAVGLADSRRNTALAQEAIEMMRPELAGLHDTYAELNKLTNLQSDELAGMAMKLKGAKVSAADMSEALKAAALAEVALGKGGADEFIAQIKEGKHSVGVLAAETQAKLGGVVAKQMHGLAAQSETLKQHLGDIFGGLNIEPVLDGMQTLVEIFDKTSAAGQTIQFLFETIFQPIIDNAQVAAYAVEAFILGFLIGATKLYIALKPVISAVSEFFGFDDTTLADTMATITDVAEVLFYALAGGAALIGGAFALALVASASLAAPLILAITAIGAAVYGIIEAFSLAIDFIRGLDFGQIGSDIIAGLVNGLSSGASAVKDALVGAVSGAVDSAKAFLGIHSPSTLLYDTVGEPMAAGVETALEDSGPDVGDALQTMVEPPAIAKQDALSGNLSGGSSSGGGKTAAPSGPITFVFQGVQGAEDALSRFEELATKLLEGDAASLVGAMVTGEAAA